MEIECKFCKILDCYHCFEQYDNGQIDFYYKISDDAYYIFDWLDNQLTLTCHVAAKLEGRDYNYNKPKVYFNKKFYFDEFPSESQISSIIENLVFAWLC